MKKLIIGAIALVGTTLFANAACNEGQPCPFGYQIKIYVKTTGAQKAAPECGSVCFRAPSVKRLAGFVYGATAYDAPSCGCGEGSCGCNAWESAEFLLWDYDTKAEAMPQKVQLVKLDRIYNGDTTTAEIALKLIGENYDLNLAGFGRVAKRDGQWTLKNAAGFCAGVLPCESCDFPCETVSSKVWSICASETEAPDLDSKSTAVYGKWSLDWSSTIYNRVLTGLPVTKPGAAWDEIKPIAIEDAR